MNVGLRLDLRQSQQLVMTPQLQQAIKLLQMSNLELGAFVENELEKNPLLRAEGEVVDPPSPGDAPEHPLPPADTPVEATDSRTEDHGLSADTFDTGTENLHDSTPSDGPSPLSDYRGSSSGGGGRDFDSLPSDEERIAEEVSLREHLLTQIAQSRAQPQDIHIARYLVDELDEHGYLRADLTEVAEKLGTAFSDIESGLNVLQTCEPTGVGARDLAECLRLQLAEAGVLDAELECLLTHLDLLGRNDRRKLCQLCKVDEDSLNELIRTLQTTNPRPCSGFDAVQAQTLIPDVLLKRTSWGGWQVELNPDTLPRVLLDRDYIAEFGPGADTETKQFLADCRSNASWLIKSLDQRAKTIVKIAAEVVMQQEGFFARGISGLKPLTLREVADAVSMHESTASRVTANKYIATERGIFELKFFFTNAVGGGDGDIAAEAVRHRIRTMVNAEPANAVLSDDSIVDALCKEGIEIARRTVAKYRQSLNIPSSVERRRQKAVAAHPLV
ncbi:MAG: RNA polymerase factor sigma-54 [Paracoccaceae bacterium]